MLSSNCNGCNIKNLYDHILTSAWFSLVLDCFRIWLNDESFHLVVPEAQMVRLIQQNFNKLKRGFLKHMKKQDFKNLVLKSAAILRKEFSRDVKGIFVL